jgi:hypothetical protein
LRFILSLRSDSPIEIPFNHLKGFSNAIMLPSVLQTQKIKDRKEKRLWRK